MAGVFEISIHALHMEGDTMGRARIGEGIISIHALHMEGDAGNLGVDLILGISIHALHMEGDPFYPLAH